MYILDLFLKQRQSMEGVILIFCRLSLSPNWEDKSLGLQLLLAMLCSLPHHKYSTHKHTDTAWPPRSPDISPLDILSSHVKTLFTKVTLFELTAPKVSSYNSDTATGKSFHRIDRCITKGDSFIEA
jgi:hypothetical protein